METEYRIMRAKEIHRKEISRLVRKAHIGALKKSDSLKDFSIVVLNGEIVGCMGIEYIPNNAAVLTYAVTKKEFRHLGIATRLMSFKAKEAKKKGVSLLALCTMYYLFRFCKKRGYKTCPREFLPVRIKDYWMFTARQYKKCAVLYRSI
ncbi:MAG: hypothetical protein A3H69_04060 [Candidatus Sungbacteria bacterium RIFCSPLOWO2_02_FULL_47_9]|uniref:N-acetyltransferase domain-containing protein n=1 Tax=Candidatus Sungbacteria bacterium RIFCSPHIGHO2_01_FULL_47_32 TaxID=1802264 RepID=A0A1G2K8X0_9BACT|nr:MAG: hypothetical protein UX72_C0014G0006 [Parcubacteria group bacterium GW2011_GWA2_47_10]OGZ95825.1 MAG: hypothetical protein A2633_00305 [Candidatus Sungbacteria bacterium RIFCSPHIGHO2_01_FULL_47_32]OGZ98617.1 MAG: hypothetical protein A3D57_03540 [Candidatus Sungbacteria bacterium RIFCSPHIGHO2_02_FULL_46_12]OHA04422.1 MAG: hypothetical protein A3A28_06020 [Candidatus Sungbacteria bacterium RIFCSPLOWO2_01_FULL_47_32]OHA11784.1 MAG: hypothetical protein A3H69_04060 [Candidatus Sungbacteria